MKLITLTFALNIILLLMYTMLNIITYKMFQ